MTVASSVGDSCQVLAAEIDGFPNLGSAEKLINGSDMGWERSRLAYTLDCGSLFPPPSTVLISINLCVKTASGPGNHKLSLVYPREVQKLFQCVTQKSRPETATFFRCP